MFGRKESARKMIIKAIRRAEIPTFVKRELEAALLGLNTELDEEERRDFEIVYKLFDGTRQGLVRVLDLFIKIKRLEGAKDLDALSAVTEKIRASKFSWTEEKVSEDKFRTVEGKIREGIIPGDEAEKISRLLIQKIEELRGLMKRYGAGGISELEDYLENLRGELTMASGHLPADELLQRIEKIEGFIARFRSRA